MNTEIPLVDLNIIEAVPMWTQVDALALAKDWELSVVRRFGYHVAVGGSIIYKGESQKDLDLFLYPHKTTDAQLRNGLFETLVKQGWSEPVECSHERYGDDKLVYESVRDGKKINIFFVQ